MSVRPARWLMGERGAECRSGSDRGGATAKKGGQFLNSVVPKAVGASPMRRSLGMQHPMGEERGFYEVKLGTRSRSRQRTHGRKRTYYRAAKGAPRRRCRDLWHPKEC